MMMKLPWWARARQHGDYRTKFCLLPRITDDGYLVWLRRVHLIWNEDLTRSLTHDESRWMVYAHSSAWEI